MGKLQLQLTKKKLSFGWIFVIILLLALVIRVFPVKTPCNAPYVDYDGQCCLDNNENNVCDKFERTIPEISEEIIEEPKTDSIEPQIANPFCVDTQCLDVEYQNYFKENPLLLEIILESQHDLREIINFINELEFSGRINMEKPAISLAQDCLSGQEIYLIRAAKIAHSIWLDKTKKLPWRLKDYSKEELEILLNDRTMDECSFKFYVMDYSPSDAYDYAKSFIKENQLETTYAIIRDLRKDFQHAGNEEEGKPYYRSLTEDLNTYYNDFLGSHRISRQGCQTMVGISVALLESINVPAYGERDWFFEPGHASGFFPSINRVLFHGDDIYDAGLWVVPIEELLMPEEYFVANIKPCKSSFFPEDCLKTAAMDYKFELYLKYPSSYFTYCAKTDNCEVCIDDTTVEAFNNNIASVQLEQYQQMMKNKIC